MHFLSFIEHRRFLCLSLISTLCLFGLFPLTVRSQDKSPEFPKGLTGYAYLQQGVVSDFNKNTPRHYQVGLGIRPEWTIIPQTLRVGVQAQLINARNTWQLQAGPTVSLRLADLKAGAYGTFANMQLNAGHLWGSHGQRLAGGGFQIEFFQLATLALSVYRDYGQQQWWIQTALGFNLLMKRRAVAPDPFSQP